MSFHDDYKPIRNKIRQYDPISIIEFLIQKLHELYYKSPNEWNGYLPWQLLLLLKWVLANYEAINTRAVNRNVKQADLSFINELINSLQHLFDKYEFEQPASAHDNKHKSEKFLRQKLFQQLWLQPYSRLSISSQARAYYLFCSHDLNTESLKKVDNYFVAKTGISIDTFFEISLIVWAQFQTSDNKEVFITKNCFENCAHTFSNNEIDKYFQLLSLDLSGAKEYANSDINSKNKRDYLKYQIFEQSPLTTYPFLRVGERYFIYSPALLDYVVKYFIYDFLKQHEGSGFSEVFGRDIFESYLKKGLEYSGLEFKDESAQPRKSKKVDFLIEDDNKTLLIEAKAVEMASIAIAKADNESIFKALETNVLKGIKQAYSIASSLKNKPVYALIITYKELFLGSTGSAWNEFLGKALEEFLSENQIDRNCIHSDRIYVLSVDDFDKLMMVIKNGYNVFDILDSISEKDKDNVRGRIFFGDHLNEVLPKDDRILPHLENEVNKLRKQVESRFIR